MDLGIAGRAALVCAASKGLGKACAMALARDGARVTIVARGREALDAAAEEIGAASGVEVTAIAADVTTADGREAALAACPEPDILINNAGGPPPGNFRDWSRDDWIAALDANMLSAIELIKASLDGMMARRFGRVVNITSAAVKAPIPVLGLSNGARTGLTGFIAGLAREVAPHGVTINNLLPGTFDTDRGRAVIAANAEKQGIGFEEALADAQRRNPTGRLGDPAEFGAACAFLCGAQAGFITGHNLLLDGGAFPGTM